MKPSEYAEAVRRETRALASIVAASPESAVPSCPGWSVTDLGEHLAGVQRFWADLVEHGRTDRDDVKPATRPDGTPLAAWLLEGGTILADLLAAADPSAPVWTWSDDKTAGFVQRRQAQEAAVHRWDGEAAAGRPNPIEPALAADGLDEFFEVMLPSGQDPPLTGDGETIAVLPTDAGDPWRATFRPGGVTVERGQSDADCVLTGKASDLLLVLWRRLPEETISVEGNVGRLIRLMSKLDLS